jgi:8-oxo-dGTP diphosphatase
MRCDGGEFVPNREVDEILWLRPDDARERLTYEHDRQVLDDAVG